MYHNKSITQGYLKSRVNYDPETGIFTWINTFPKLIGKRAGHRKRTDGFRLLRISNETYSEARLAWLYMTGNFPKDNEEVGHFNRINDDNRFINIRVQSRTQQNYYRRTNVANKTGTKGVKFDPDAKNYVANITIQGKSKRVGTFPTLEEAVLARKEAAKVIQGKFYNSKDFHLTQKELKRILDYDPETGEFIRKISTAANAIKGDTAGGSSTLYTTIKIKNKNYAAHRLAWLYMTGEFPTLPINHINDIKTDNRFINLRKATLAECQYQSDRLSAANTSGEKGVCWRKSRNRWEATIIVGGKEKYLGRFIKIEDAARAYDRACKKYHGKFYRKNLSAAN